MTGRDRHLHTCAGCHRVWGCGNRACVAPDTAWCREIAICPRPPAAAHWHRLETLIEAADALGMVADTLALTRAADFAPRVRALRDAMIAEAWACDRKDRMTEASPRASSGFIAPWLPTS